MSTQDVANKLVELARSGKWNEATEQLYSENIVSVEPEGHPMGTAEGIDAKRQKDAQFTSMVEEFHGMDISDPLVADNYFSVSMTMDVTMKEAGRQQMEEICLYRVNSDGLIDREEFHYTPQG